MIKCGSILTVTNGTKKNCILSDWKVIDDISDRNDLTAKPKPEDEIGLVGVDFEQLLNADFPFAKIFLHLWPGEAIKQLKKLNRKFTIWFPKLKLVTLKEFFEFVSILISAAPA